MFRFFNHVKKEAVNPDIGRVAGPLCHSPDMDEVDPHEPK